MVKMQTNFSNLKRMQCRSYQLLSKAHGFIANPFSGFEVLNFDIQSDNHTLNNCGENWPIQHNVDNVQGLSPCLREEDRNENFPCTSTKNINWFLNTMNECFSQSNVIFNHSNFIDVLDNSQYYNGLYLSHIHYALENFKM